MLWFSSSILCTYTGIDGRVFLLMPYFSDTKITIFVEKANIGRILPPATSAQLSNFLFLTFNLLLALHFVTHDGKMVRTKFVYVVLFLYLANGNIF